MEGEVAKRRINLISGHFASSNDDLSATHLLPMNCSSSLNSVIRRGDNRLNFARQGSSYQGSFMRQVSSEQFSSAQSGEPLKCSGSANEGYCYASEVPLFSRPAKMGPNLVNLGVTQRGSANEGYYYASGRPMFSKPAKMEPNLVNLGVTQPVSATEPPKFARPNRRMSEQKQFHSKKKYSSAFNGNDWSPRMDVAESGRKYIMTVEIPGVDANDIRVEVNDQHLTVMGKRSTKCWTMAGCPYNSISAYHKKEILQGPYRVMWPLPSDVNKDGISAEFVDGLLQVIIPKL